MQNKSVEHIKTPNKMAKRDSSKGAHLSNAAIIGMANLYGVSITVNVPKRSKQNLTELNIKILETSITGNVDIYTIPGLPPMENQNDPKERRRRDTSLQAYYTNQMISFIGMKDSELQVEMRKSRPTEKTIKQIKLKKIDPFNEKGFETFGEGIISILEGIANETIEGNILSKHGRGTKIQLQNNHHKINELYNQLTEQDELLSVNGKSKKSSMTTSIGMTNEQITSQENQLSFEYQQQLNYQEVQNIEYQNGVEVQEQQPKQPYIPQIQINNNDWYLTSTQQIYEQPTYCLSFRQIQIIPQYQQF